MRVEPEGPPGPAPHQGLPMNILGMYLFIASETIIFAALLVIFFWVRAGSSGARPPPEQPRLPVVVTGVNTIILLISGYTMYRAWATVASNACPACRSCSA